MKTSKSTPRSKPILTDSLIIDRDWLVDVEEHIAQMKAELEYMKQLSIKLTDLIEEVS